MWKYAAILTLAIGTGSACEKKCAHAGGDFVMTYAEIEGDCPDELVKSFDGKSADISFEAGECRRFAVQHSAELPNGCELDTDMSAELEMSGVQAGQAAFTLRCTKPEPYTCRHLFSVKYELKK